MPSCIDSSRTSRSMVAPSGTLTSPSPSFAADGQRDRLLAHLPRAVDEVVHIDGVRGGSELGHDQLFYADRGLSGRSACTLGWRPGGRDERDRDERRFRPAAPARPAPRAPPSTRSQIVGEPDRRGAGRRPEGVPLAHRQQASARPRPPACPPPLRRPVRRSARRLGVGHRPAEIAGRVAQLIPRDATRRPIRRVSRLQPVAAPDAAQDGRGQQERHDEQRDPDAGERPAAAAWSRSPRRAARTLVGSVGTSALRLRGRGRLRRGRDRCRLASAAACSSGWCRGRPSARTAPSRRRRSTARARRAGRRSSRCTGRGCSPCPPFVAPGR